ncbi:MAG TPA: adenylate/guanylate cyclase domain-containing protein [Planctomycetota bacterium]|nr:adenylate/guanylate cyclase domain-containing protein [Planctomycetota bacterium]
MPALPAELIVTSPDGHVNRYPLGDACVIGRHPECQVVLTDPMSSRRHCRIDRTPDGKISVQDNGSANGTLLNGQPLKERIAVKNGDTVQIGSTLIVLRVETPIGSSGKHPRARADVTIVSLVDEQEESSQPAINYSKDVDQNLLTEEERSSFDVNQLKQVTKRLELLVAVGQAMGASLDPHKLLDKCLEKLFEVFPQTDRGIIVLYGPDGSVPSKLTSEQEQAGVLDRRKGAITKVRFSAGTMRDNEIKLSRTVLRKVSAERKAFIFNDGGGAGEGMSIAKFQIKSLMCAPLITEKDDIGFIQIETKNLLNPFNQQDLDILSAVAGQVAVVIRNAELAVNMASAAAQRESLSRFLSPQLVEDVLNARLSIALGGVEKKGTVFFSDIVSFTRIASKISPQNAVALLNRYFTVMQNIIFKRGGSIDKCAGDNIMAHWGVLGDMTYCPESAVTAAVEMQIALFTFNRAESLRKEEGFTPVMLGHGIGLNTGMICAGNIGSERKIEFTVIGDAVNLSARIEAMAGRGQTFVGEPTWKEVESRAFGFRMPDCPAKNVEGRLPIYSVRGIIAPPEKNEKEEPAGWNVSDLLLCLPCTLIAADGTRANGVVITIFAGAGAAPWKLELHMEKFIPPGAKVKLEWNVPEKASLPSFEGEVDASFPIDAAHSGAMSSAIARGRTAIIQERMHPGMLLLKTTTLPAAIAEIKPGLLVPSDLTSHEQIIRA